MLPNRPTLDELSNMEIAYSPAFAQALDIVNAAANTAENIIDGYNRILEPDEFQRYFLDEETDNILCLDVRGPANAAPYVDKFGPRWMNIPQETLKYHLDELPRDKRLFVVCNSGIRSFKALRQLESAGFSNAVNLQGGVVVLKKTGLVDLSNEKEDKA
jgi:rhodanese-related sulfurtransferase